MTVVECLLFFISTVYFGISALFIYVCVWLMGIFDDINYKLSENPLTDPVTILLVICCITLLLGILGCCANCQQSKAFIYIFGVFTVLAVLVVLSAAFLAVAYKVEANKNVHKSIDKAIGSYNNTGRGSDSALDFLQNKLQCCGSANASDWINSTFWLQERKDPKNRTETYLLPKSCCIDKKEKCKLNIGNFYKEGCSNLVVPKLKRYLKYGLGLCFGLACIQIIGVILSCGWIGMSRQREVHKYMKINGGTYA